MRSYRSLPLLAAVALAACSLPDATGPAASVPPALSAGSAPVGGVFTSTNSTAGNAVVAFARRADGTLEPTGTYPTGGTGTGAALGSQFALVLSGDARFLFVVNAGSNSVSSFAVDKGALTLVATVATGGVRPVSVAASRQTLYVLNAGSNTVTGFDVGPSGALTPRPDVAAALNPAAAGAAQVSVSPDGRFLTVAERFSNTIDTWLVAEDGSLSGRITNASAGATPFGFDYTNRGQVVVSEAGSGSASSYAQGRDGALTAVSAAAPTFQRAPCWLVVNNAGSLAYTANAASGTITGFAIGANGDLTRLAADGVSADLRVDPNVAPQPLDIDMSRNGRFLYVFENGSGSISAWDVGPDGALQLVGRAAEGIAARAGYAGLVAY